MGEKKGAAGSPDIYELTHPRDSHKISGGAERILSLLTRVWPMLFAGPVPNVTSPCMAGLSPNGISRSEQSNSSSLVFNFKKPAAGAAFPAR